MKLKKYLDADEEENELKDGDEVEVDVEGRKPPQAVKSILVWKAKMVRAKVTPAVIPT